MKKETDFIKKQNTPKFADVFFELFIALVPFLLVSLISYLPIQLTLSGLCMFWFYKTTEKVQHDLVKLSFHQSFSLNLLFVSILGMWEIWSRIYELSSGFSFPFWLGFLSYLIATWPVITRREKTIMKLRSFSYFNWYWGVSCSFFAWYLTSLI